MNHLFEVAARFFRDDEWFPQILEGETALRMGFKGQSGRWSCLLRVREEQRQILFYSILDNFVPEGKRPVVAEFINRANCGLFFGNFEMDYEDGEIRFKTSIDVNGTAEIVGAALIRNLAYSNVMVMDQYFQGFMGVIYGGLAPRSAIERIEDGDDVLESDFLELDSEPTRH